MGLVFGKTDYKGSFPVFWRGEAKVLPGDFKLTDDLPEGTVIKKGTPIKLDFANMQATLCKAIKVVAGGDTTNVRVEKGSHVVTSESVGSTTISQIDSTNADYDVLTLAAAEATATAGKILEVGENEPNAVVEKDVTIKKDMGFGTISAVFDAVILKDVAYPVPDSWLVNGMCLNTNHSIKYIRQ